MKIDTLKNVFGRFLPVLMVILSPAALMAQVDGEYRSAATGVWGTAATWQRYTASSSTWATAAAAPSGATATITVRNGHTVTVAANTSFRKLTIDAGGSVVSDASERRLDFVADTSYLINNGNLGGAAASNFEKIGITPTPTCKLATISGTGTTSVARIRFNASTSSVTNASTLVIDHNMTVTSSGITGFYNNASNIVAEDATVIINAGKTVTMSGGLHAASATQTTGGKYTYIINGTLDMSATTATSYIYPLPDASSTVTVTVSGLWKINNLNTNYTGTNAGKVVMNILNGGIVDASRANTFNLGTEYFITSGTGALKRTVTVGTPVTFPVGTSETAYNPLVMNATTVDDTVSVGVSSTLIHAIGDPTKIVTKQWNITPVGGGAGLTAGFNWQTADQGVAFNQTNPLSIFRTSGTAWAPVSAAAAITGSGTIAAPYTTSATVAPATLSGSYVVGNTDAQVVVIPTVAITAAPGNTVCAGVPVTFTAATTNITGPHYQWKVGGTNVGADQNTYTSSTLTNANVVTCVVSYTVGGAAAATSNATTMTITPLANAGTITGSGTVCSGTSEQLSNTATGGTWSSSNTAFATVSATGLVTGVSIGSVTIRYAVTNSCGTVTATKVMEVTLGADAGTLSGNTAPLCPAATTTLTSTRSGGAWSSNNTAVATVSAAGVVTAVAGGSATIAYVVENGCGKDSAKQVITVNARANAGTISGPAVVCAGATITLTSTVTGGAWTSNSSRATVAAGVVRGVNTGSAIITYKVTTTCGTDSVNYTVAIDSIPAVGAISGASSVCEGATTTLTNTVAGGVWSNTNAATLTVSATGVVSGIASGADVITYTVTNTCGVGRATKNITVAALPVASTVTGSDSVCLRDIVTFRAGTPNGFWSSTSGKTAVSTDGIVTGLAVGYDTIVYTMVNQCGSSATRRAIYVWNCNPTGIPGVNGNGLSASLFPNPNNGSFNFKLSSLKNEEVRIVITNMVGAVVAEKIGRTNEQVNIQLNQPAGIYLLNAITAAGRSVIKVNITE
jgi:hypothetical protein